MPACREAGGPLCLTPTCTVVPWPYVARLAINVISRTDRDNLITFSESSSGELFKNGILCGNISLGYREASSFPKGKLHNGVRLIFRNRKEITAIIV